MHVSRTLTVGEQWWILKFPALRLYEVWAAMVGEHDAIVSDAEVSTCRTTGLTLARSGNQVQTPDCGACAPGFEPFDPSYFNGSVSGVRSVTCNPVAIHMRLAERCCIPQNASC